MWVWSGIAKEEGDKGGMIQRDGLAVLYNRMMTKILG